MERFHRRLALPQEGANVERTKATIDRGCGPDHDPSQWDAATLILLAADRASSHASGSPSQRRQRR